jgi:hypothetical protein
VFEFTREFINVFEFIREFINVFEAEVQKLQADQLQLGTFSHWYQLMSCLVITIK